MSNMSPPPLSPRRATSSGPPSRSCDPCVDRPYLSVRAIVHGTRSSPFWLQVRSAAAQSGRDARVDLRFDLYDSFDSRRMADDILNAARPGPGRPDALIVTIPTEAVRDAASSAARAGVPVFGLNSGFEDASDVGALGYVAMDEYRGGSEAGAEFLRRGRNVTRALFVDRGEDNAALNARFRGFRDAMMRAGGRNNDTEGGIHVDRITEAVGPGGGGGASNIAAAMEGCGYDAVLLGGAFLLERATSAFYANGCPLSDHMLGTFDTNPAVYDDIAVGKIAFAVSQQQHLQGALSVAMASVFVTTGKRLALSAESEFGVYLSGPSIVNLRSLPTDTLQTCEGSAFPVCPNTKSIDGVRESNCDCADRGGMRIGGVLHGVTTDPFWDLVFAASHQAAADLGVELLLDRLEPEENNEILHTKMAGRILSLCMDGVDGLFVSIPHDDVVPAVEECLRLNVPVISINSGAEASRRLGLMHHVAQLEHTAGLEAGRRLIAGGMVRGACLRHYDTPALMERCRGMEDAVREAVGNVTYLGVVDVPPDNGALFVRAVEEALALSDPGGGDDWEGLGLLFLWADKVEEGLVLRSRHPKVLIGSFDTSDRLYSAMDDGAVLFGIDQEPYLQGYMPVLLLTYYAHTRQRLANMFVESGPRFLDASPSPGQKVCEANLYEVCPDPTDYDLNRIGAVRPVGLALAAAILACSVGFAAWVVRNRRKRVVKASQPVFLVTICVGTAVMGATIVPMSIDDGVATVRGCDVACVAAPWLFTTGFTITFSALFSKIWRINLLLSSAQSFRRLTLTARDVTMPLTSLLGLNVMLMLAWTLADPPRWERVPDCGSDGHSSYGYCSLGETGISTAMFVSVLTVNLCALVLANAQAYRGRKVVTEYNESKYVAVAMLGILEVIVLGIPLSFLVVENPPASFFVRSGIVFVTSASILLLIFVPKVRQLAKGKREGPSVRRRGALQRHFSGSPAISDGRVSDVGLRVCHPKAMVEKSKVEHLGSILRERGIESEPLFQQAGISLGWSTEHLDGGVRRRASYTCDQIIVSNRNNTP